MAQLAITSMFSRFMLAGKRASISTKSFAAFKSPVAPLFATWVRIALRMVIYLGREFRWLFPENRANPRQFASFHCQTGPERVFVLALDLDALPVFSDRQASSPVSAIPVGE